MLAEKLIEGLGKSQNRHRCLCPQTFCLDRLPSSKIFSFPFASLATCWSGSLLPLHGVL